jgi:hypothetical protein
MFVPCIIRRSTNNQHYALICNNPLFYILAATCFDSSLPSSWSFLDPSELLEIQIEWVVYHVMCGYVACVPAFRGSICRASQLSAYALSWEAASLRFLHFTIPVIFSVPSSNFTTV